MPTDIPAFREAIVEERAAVQAALDIIDLNDEEARFNAAEAAFRTARQTHARAARRWGFITDKQDRLRELDAQIDLVTP